jgi:hypothetical protein
MQRIWTLLTARRLTLAILGAMASTSVLIAAAVGPVDTTAAATLGWHGFGVGHWPGGNWRPYSGSSPFNRPIDGTRVHPGSRAMVDYVLSHSGKPAPLVVGTSDRGDDWAHPVYYSQPSNPSVTLKQTTDWASDGINGARIPVPARAQPADGTDHHMTIVTPNGWEYDLWEARRSGDTIYFASGGRERISGDGIGSGSTASGFAALAGVIRPEELATGHIDHALFIVLGCTSDALSFGDGEHPPPPQDDSSSFVYPATNGGSRCSPEESQHMPPMGTRFWLDMSRRQIQKLAVPRWKKMILTALAVYGGYVGDTGGPGFSFEFQSSATYTSFGFRDPLVTLARLYHIPAWHGQYAFNLAKGVNWKRYLRVVVPPPQTSANSS